MRAKQPEREAGFALTGADANAQAFAIFGGKRGPADRRRDRSLSNNPAGKIAAKKCRIRVIAIEEGDAVCSNTVAAGTQQNITYCWLAIDKGLI